MHKWQRRLWISGVGLGASLLIVAGLLVGAFRIAVQLVPDYRADVEQRVAELFSTEVRIQGMDLIWRGRYPTLQLQDVAVGAAVEGGLQLQELRIGFSLWRLLQGDLMPRRVQMRGTTLQLSLKDGQLALGGVRSDGSSQQAPQAFLDQLQRIGRIELSDARLRWIDHDHGLPMRELRLQQVAGSSTSRGMALEVEAELIGQAGSLLRAEMDLLKSPWRLSDIELRVSELEIWRDLQALIPQMPLLQGQVRQLGLQAQFRAGRWETAQIDFLLENFGPQGSSQRFGRWQGGLLLNALGQGLRMELQSDELVGPSGRWPENLLAAEWHPSDQGWGRVSLSAQYLRLDDLGLWAGLLPPGFLAHWQAWRPAGELRQLVLQASSEQPWPQLTADLDRIHVAAHDGWPGVREFSGSLSMDPAGGRLLVASQDLVLEAPKIFALPLPMKQLSGNVSWQRSGEGWRINAPSLHYEAMNLDGVGRLSLELGRQASIDLALDFFCSDPGPWLEYQPLHWSKGLRRWLAKAVPRANVRAGQVQIRGELADFPFVDGKPGIFRVALDLEDSRLNFAPDWPAVDMESAKLVLEGRSLRVDAFNGRIGNMTAASIQAGIADLGMSVLNVKAGLRGNAADAWKMLGASNLSRKLTATLESLALSGNTELDLDLSLPLREMQDADYQILARFDRAALWTRFWPDPVQKIRGEILINRDGLRSRDLSAALAGIPLAISLQPAAGLTRIEAQFEAGIHEFPDSVPIPAWLKNRASGRSQWRFDMEVGTGARSDLRIGSNLLGTRWELPSPFGKAEEELRRLDVTVKPEDATRVHVSYAQLLGFDALLGKAGKGLAAARLNLGGDVGPAGAPGWWVEGQLGQARLTDWLPVIRDLASEAGPGATDVSFGGMVLHLGEFEALGQHLAQARLQMMRDAKEWTIALTSSRADGVLRIPRQQNGDRLSMSGEFSRLRWVWQETDTPAERADPREVPELRLQVSNFSLNEVPLGSMVLDLSPVSRGVRIERFGVFADQQQEVKVTGLWLLDDVAGESAALEFAIDTRSVANWLSALGYQDNIVAERAQASGQLSWAPNPDGLKFASLDGDLKFDFAQGQLLNVEPGAGRALGLFSVNALPRRFFLDFSDVVKTGLGFDSMRGQFKIKSGVAHTDDLVVKSPSLRIAARGDVDLARRRYDQTITIYPGLSSGVSLAATVLGGPVLGIFTLLAQELLDKPLDQVTQISYHLGGDWQNPQVSRQQ